MFHDDLDSLSGLQMFGHLLSQIDRAVLTAGAAEGNRQALEPSLQIVVNSGVNQRGRMRQKLVQPLPVFQDTR